MMKRVRINTGFVALVFKNGNYTKVLTEGRYWLASGTTAILYNMVKPFYPTIDLNILLRDEQLEEMLTMVEVKDNEIVVQYENGIFKNVLTAGRYAFWKGVTEYSFSKVDLNEIEIDKSIDRSLLQKPQLLPYIRVYVVEDYEKGLLFKDGRFEKEVAPGIYFYWKNPTALALKKADMRQLQMEISGQEILTKDKAALRVNFFAQYKVTDVTRALVENKDFDRQLYVLIQLALREYVGTRNLDELLENKEQVAPYILNVLKDKASELGVEILNGGIRDVILPGEVREIMNQVLVAEKRAQANTITRREETASTRSLLNTAKLMEDNSMLFKLKEMEYVEKIAEKINSITLSNGALVVDQLRDIFSPVK
ncbi:MAG: slipin family protein [Bacteroidales bacterium]|nr:slipin family protein [Bacteroidales bacterium]MCF8455027.1 slipin family protein [Bacteroidales bacterium]